MILGKTTIKPMNESHTIPLMRKPAIDSAIK